LAARHGTPLYVYDAAAVRRAYAAVRACFGPFQVSYSFKANPNPHLAGLLRRLGAAADVASGGELYAALAAGFAPADISFGGPAKNEDELDAALKAGVQHFIVESRTELDRLDRRCRLLGRRVECSIRLNTFGTRHGSLREEMTGPPTKFGFDRRALAALFAALKAKPSGCELCGVHVYNASGILGERLIARNLAVALAEARRVAKNYQMPIKRFTFGPGLGVAYLPNQRDPDMKALSRLVKPILAAELGQDIFRDTTLQLELGRYLVASAGVFLTRVLDVKTCRGKRFILTDGGINHFLRSVLMGHNHPTEIVGRRGGILSAADVCGPLCTPIDTIARNVRLPKVVVGDLVAIRRAGAYGCTMGMLAFLGHRAPAEVLVDQGRGRVIRRRSGFGDVLVNIPPLR
jgi:diaminopimelate decarboxylase